MRETLGNRLYDGVYICSPYWAKDKKELKRNIKYARRLTKHAIEHGGAPITPHLYITQCLDDNNPKEREMGLAAGIKLIPLCSTILIGNKYGISEGMAREIEIAKALGLRILHEMKM